MSEETKRIYLTVPVGFEEKLKKVADADRRTPSLYIVNLIEKIYEKLELDKQ